MNPILSTDPHRRYNPLTGDWGAGYRYLLIPGTQGRPWQGKRKARQLRFVSHTILIAILVPEMPAREGSEIRSTRQPSFSDNDFAALRPDTASAEINDEGLIVAKTEKGLCRVSASPRITA